MSDDLRTFSVEEVAELCGVSRETVTAWITRGELSAWDACEKPGAKRRRWRITAAALLAFQAKRANHESTPTKRPPRAGRHPLLKGITRHF